jgi:aspartate aminotransferase-like enzyme
MTPAMALIFALDVQLDRIFAEGLDERFARHAAMAKKVQDWSIARGMEPLAKPEYRSKTVVTIKNSLGWDISALNKFLQARGMRIANGYGKIKDLTYRIATMGETTLADVDALLAAMEDYMKQG